MTISQPFANVVQQQLNQIQIAFVSCQHSPTLKHLIENFMDYLINDSELIHPKDYSEFKKYYTNKEFWEEIFEFPKTVPEKYVSVLILLKFIRDKNFSNLVPIVFYSKVYDKFGAMIEYVKNYSPYIASDFSELKYNKLLGKFSDKLQESIDKFLEAEKVFFMENPLIFTNLDLTYHDDFFLQEKNNRYVEFRSNYVCPNSVVYFAKENGSKHLYSLKKGSLVYTNLYTK